MYARSTTFHGRPDNIDAGITFIKSEAGPMLDKIEGCRGLSMLVDHETGQCIATSSWENEAAMRASDEQLRPIRDRGRDILGGSMQVDEWEIAVMHRTHHGECCRVSWLRGDPDAMTETVRVEILPLLEQTPGFCSASLHVNRSTGILGGGSKLPREDPSIEQTFLRRRDHAAAALNAYAGAEI